MASPAVANILQGRPAVSGGVLRATLGTALPVSASASTSAFTGLGYVGDAGLTETIDRTTDKIKAWGGDVVKIVQSEFSVTYEFTLYETVNTDVLKTVHGAANVTVTAPTSTTGTLRKVLINSASLEHAAWVIDMKDGSALIRVVIADGQVSNVGAITYTDGAVIGYPVTIECFRDASGNQAVKYIDDGVFV